MSALDVKSWQSQPPSVEQARPPACPRCRAASRPAGAQLGLPGHGLRSRQLRGPVTPEGPALQLVLDLRRYRCRHCDAVITVVPRGVLPHRVFSACAIAMALALWALLHVPAHAVRARINPALFVGATAAARWLQLRRWAQQLPALFPALRLRTRDAPRDLAAEAASALAGYAPPSLRTTPLPAQAFVGALLVP